MCPPRASGWPRPRSETTLNRFNPFNPGNPFNLFNPFNPFNLHTAHASRLTPHASRIMSLWVIRILFLMLCTVGGYAISQVRQELVGLTYSGAIGMVIGFGFGWLMIAVDEMLKGFSLRAFSATTFGLLLGTVVALLIDHSGLFERADEKTRWIIRLCLFIGFGYIGIILAMRSNKEDFSLIIPYVRFASQNKPETPLLFDTSAIIDGRIVEMIDEDFVEGMSVVPR